uniref:Uncharacterized protein n=1 Tax=Rhizophora mucronata TaxID=61149 RepID=A0A2P2NN44_RHIMU
MGAFTFLVSFRAMCLSSLLNLHGDFLLPVLLLN